jgi:glycosyltransferase involved in cell wall biosynthesis
MNLIFLQNRPHRAGAQTCLARLLREFQRYPGIKASLVCGSEGWLTDQARTLAVDTQIVPFPSSRSWMGRLWRNQSFVHSVRLLSNRAATKGWIVANDHGENLLALALARRSRLSSCVFLRSSGMTEADYFKYACDQSDAVVSVGPTLAQQARIWDPDGSHHFIPDGLEDADFSRPMHLPQSFPREVLVLGTPHPDKGWGDLRNALKLLPPALSQNTEWHFTGPIPEEFAPQPNFHFRNERGDLRDIFTNYPLVIAPSRRESFGMAACESLAAGCALLSSRTGILGEVLQDSAWLFEPGNPADLAEKLHYLWNNWPDVPHPGFAAQEVLRSRFHVKNTVQELHRVFESH